MPRNRVHSVAANFSVPAYERDVTVLCTAVDLVVSLPPAGRGTTGNRVRVVTLAASGGTGTSISPTAVDQVRGTGITAADDKDLINTGATDAVGDVAELVCDGDAGWVITNLIGTWAREA